MPKSNKPVADLPLIVTEPRSASGGSCNSGKGPTRRNFVIPIRRARNHRRLSSTSLSSARSAFAVVIKGLGVPIVWNTTEAITAPRIGAIMKSQSCPSAPSLRQKPPG